MIRAIVNSDQSLLDKCSYLPASHGISGWGIVGDKCNVEGTLAYAQRVAIEEALKECGYNISHAAKRLQIGRTTLYNLMQKYRIVGVEPRERLSSRMLTKPRRDPSEVHYLNGNWYLRSSGNKPA